MKFFFLIILVSCATQKPQTPSEENLVSVNAALNQAQASYLKGCVDAMRALKIPVAFPNCSDKSIIHRRELDAIMEQDI